MQTVAQEYCDEGIIQRLLFAARQTEGLETEVECLKIVHDEIKNNVCVLSFLSKERGWNWMMLFVGWQSVNAGLCMSL